jgi:hypothetical protein
MIWATIFLVSLLFVMVGRRWMRNPGTDTGNDVLGYWMAVLGVIGIAACFVHVIP